MANFLRSALAFVARTVVNSFGLAYESAARGHRVGEDLGGAVATKLLRKPMTSDEAKQIMALEEITVEALNSRYEKLMAANDVDKGGSFYLQSKIFRAREQLLADLEVRAAKDPNVAAAAAAPGPAGAAGASGAQKP